MTINIIVNDQGNSPAGRLAEAELHFTEAPILSPHAVEALRAAGCNVVEIQEAMRSPFDGLKLIGFSIWERRGGSGRNVTFPARQYSVNGERRSFALLRPIVGAPDEDRIVYAVHRATGASVRSRALAIGECVATVTCTTRDKVDYRQLAAHYATPAWPVWEKL